MLTKGTTGHDDGQFGISAIKMTTSKDSNSADAAVFLEKGSLHLKIHFLEPAGDVFDAPKRKHAKLPQG